jgi:hypothetical protein
MFHEPQGAILSGETLFPLELAFLSHLKGLDLNVERKDSGGTFGGTLPDEYGTLTNLEVVYLPHCNIQGTLPASYGRWTNLSKLHG